MREPSKKPRGLRHVVDGEPGFTRIRTGRGFSYRSSKGQTLRDAAVRRRIRALAIPPAWSEVWICRDARGHIQATGRDEAGRKQYIYHERWRAEREGAKYERMVSFAKRLPAVRKRVAADLRKKGLPREKVLAAMVRLLETSLIRIGNAEYARNNSSYGLATIRRKHVARRGGRRAFALEFEGKSGKPWRVEVSEPRVVEVIAQCLETPGYELFKYVDGQGESRDVSSDDVNRYLREVAGADVTAKDFRTWAGTVLCARALRSNGGSNGKGNGRALVAAIDEVARRLGNTRAICRQSYIHPLVLEGFESGDLLRALETKTRRKTSGRASRGLSKEERAVLRFLESSLSNASS